MKQKKLQKTYHTKIKGRSRVKKSASPKSKDAGLRSPQIPDKECSGENQEVKVMPTLFELRQDPLIQDRLQQRLQELNQLVNTGDQKIKSHRRGVDIFVTNRVKWPHEYVLSGSTKERVSYDEFSVIEWVAGFGHTMKEEKKLK